MAEALTAVRTVPFMFLGGPLDHSTRRMPVTDGLLTPLQDTYTQITPATAAWMRYSPAPERKVVTYRRTRCSSGGASWWAYVLAGHTPTPSDLLDARPLGQM